MKFMFASDIHGSLYYCNKMKECFSQEKPHKLVLLGDLLYHGPRNDLPMNYEPKKVIDILNSLSGHIIAVRGNCEAEVDQMVLDFPCMADYVILFSDDKTMFVTHGHIYSKENPPKLAKGDIFIQGHTHIPCIENIDDRLFLNPGSVSIPKNGNKNSYMIFEDNTFVIKDMDGEVIMSVKIEE